jgi:hypothetical protein
MGSLFLGHITMLFNCRDYGAQMRLWEPRYSSMTIISDVEEMPLLML